MSVEAVAVGTEEDGAVASVSDREIDRAGGPGRDHPDDFLIDRYVVDADQWTDGFVEYPTKASRNDEPSA